MEAMAGGIIGEETADGGEERRADKQDFIFLKNTPEDKLLPVVC